ncbi:hypothetical protein CFN78_19460 [Amycolatopsis antarctica]|uniref:CHAP domain-containing protein n=1 Tax=Amycolatopsis antarctica TaxID=1854586 RepID=A0A263CZW1_9PSEU|nr:hypothetical protein CFN78_19460 [Amycolatopsis antarctica]
MARAGTVALAVLLAGSAGSTIATAEIAPAAPAVEQAGDLYSEVTAADVADPALADEGTNAAGDVDAMGTAAGAIKWFSSRKGSTEYQGYCERAARLSWDRKTHHASAIAHWNSSDGAKHTTGTPPKGAFVFWNISEYGHVGVADGNGGFWATSVGGAIGHASSVNYFNAYLGWKPGNSN